MTLGLITAGTMIGLAIAVVLLIRGLIDRNGLLVGLSAMLLMAVAAIALIVASWSAKGVASGALQLVETGLLLTTGPVLVIAVASLLETPVRRGGIIWPAALIFAIFTLDSLRNGGDPVRFAVPVQSVYILYAGILLVRRRTPDARRRAYRRGLIATGLLAAVTLINAASLARTFFTSVTSLQSIVPIAISLCLIALLLLFVWTVLERVTPVLAKRTRQDGDSDALIGRVRTLVEDDAVYRDACLTLPIVAERLGVPKSKLAIALSESAVGGFANYLQTVRVERAQAMLTDPLEGKTSIEAIGLLCGFRSRSVFYEAFRKQTGFSPGEYRRKSCPNL